MGQLDRGNGGGAEAVKFIGAVKLPKTLMRRNGISRCNPRRQQKIAQGFWS
jgi:hypothetical protein